MNEATETVIRRLKRQLGGSGGCQIVSLGDSCTCPLCDVDRLSKELRKPTLSESEPKEFIRSRSPQGFANVIEAAEFARDRSLKETRRKIEAEAKAEDDSEPETIDDGTIDAEEWERFNEFNDFDTGDGEPEPETEDPTPDPPPVEPPPIEPEQVRVQPPTVFPPEEPRMKEPTKPDDVFRQTFPPGLSPRVQYRMECDDDKEAYFKLTLTSDGDIVLSASHCVRIRTGIGGGTNHRTRQALLWLALAVKRDNEDHGRRQS